MNITYRREIKHNYLIIDPEDLPWEGYESRMLSQNIVEGLLPVKIRQTEEGTRFYYEITSRQPLLRLMQSKKLKEEEIRSLMIGIFRALESMERYLLSEKRVLLDPEYLYIEPEHYHIFLCLVPGLECDFPEAFGKLLEQMLEYVDHQDKESVVLAYRLYQESRKENYGIDDIMKLLYRSEEMKEEEIADKDEKRSNPAVMEQNVIKRSSVMDINQERMRQSSKSWRERFIDWVVKKCPFHKKEIPIQVPWEMMFHEAAYEPWSEGTDNLNQGKQREGNLPAKKSNAEPVRPINAAVCDDVQGTVLLADLTGRVGTGHRILRALDPGMEDIQISYYPFIIGKQENLVDYCLDCDTVSRLHLRIDRAGECYRLQDLNSMNGTKLRGRMLINNETDELQIGDEICIAQYRFRFE